MIFRQEARRLYELFGGFQVITYRDIVEQREALQNDLLTKLDGLEEKFLDDICNLVIDRFQILLNKLGNEVC